MAAPSQTGDSMIVGIGDYTYTGHIVEEYGKTPTAEVEKIKNEDNETKTRIVSDPGDEISLRVLAKADSTIESLDIGDTITINTVGYFVDDVQVRRSRGVLAADIRASKEDSMTYS
jgi:hypothetical protein